MRFVGRAYRGHDPAWSFTLLSGAGAARHGGRFNRPGGPRLYLSLDIATVVLECTQGLTERLLPLTLCEYEVEAEPVADLRDAAGRAAHGVTLADLACPWLRHLRAGEPAPSWAVVDRLQAAGHHGMLVPSFAPTAASHHHNLVLWRWGPEPPSRITAQDPTPSSSSVRPWTAPDPQTLSAHEAGPAWSARPPSRPRSRLLRHDRTCL